MLLFKMGKMARILLTIVSFVFADELLNTPKLEEIEHGVLIKNVGFLLQGGGESHAMLKLNLTNLEYHTEQSCSGVAKLKVFMEVKRNSKQTRIIEEITPLINTLENLCAFTKNKLKIL